VTILHAEVIGKALKEPPSSAEMTALLRDLYTDELSIMVLIDGLLRERESYAMAAKFDKVSEVEDRIANVIRVVTLAQKNGYRVRVGNGVGDRRGEGPILEIDPYKAWR